MGINENLEDIKKELQELKAEKEQPKEKKFRFPFGTKVGKSQAKKNYVTVMKINENGAVAFTKKPIEQQTIMEDGVPRLATPDYVLRFKKNPMIILPSWSVKPFSPVEQFEKSMIDGSNTKGYKILLDRMNKEQVSSKKQMGGMLKWIIGLALAGIIIYAIMSGGAS